MKEEDLSRSPPKVDPLICNSSHSFVVLILYTKSPIFNHNATAAIFLIQIGLRRSLEEKQAKLREQFDELVQEEKLVVREEQEEEVIADSTMGLLFGFFFARSPYESVLKCMGRAVHVYRASSGAKYQDEQARVLQASLPHVRKLGLIKAALIAGARDVGLSPSIIGSLSRKEAALVENLESSDPQIVTTVIGVFCELASENPKSYLPLAPEFYRILIDSKNN